MISLLKQFPLRLQSLPGDNLLSTWYLKANLEAGWIGTLNIVWNWTLLVKKQRLSRDMLELSTNRLGSILYFKPVAGALEVEVLWGLLSLLPAKWECLKPSMEPWSLPPILASAQDSAKPLLLSKSCCHSLGRCWENNSKSQEKNNNQLQLIVRHSSPRRSSPQTFITPYLFSDIHHLRHSSPPT